MSEPRDVDRIVADWLRVEAPTRAPGRVLSTALEQAGAIGQDRPWVSLGLESWRGASPRVRWAIVLVALAVAMVTAVVGAGALHKTPPKLDLTPPADLQAFVHSTYDRMPDLPPVAIDTLENGSVKGRIYVNRSGAVRIEHYATPDAPLPDTYQILTGTAKAQLAIVGTRKVWVEQPGAIAEDPRVFVLGAMEGAAAYDGPGCGVAGADPPATGWAYGGLEYIAGRPTLHVTCGRGELWIDVETRLVMRSRGPMLDAALMPVPGSSRTIEVTGLAFGDQPADLFEMAQPSGVARMSSDDYECQLQPSACATPSPTQPPYTPPPGAIVGPLPPRPPSSVKNGWIAYSTDGQAPGSTDVTTGSDIYLVREGGEPRLIAGRDRGTTRNVCPAFSPDGTRLAFGEASAQGRAVVVVGVDASGVTGAPVRITVPGPGPAVCVRWSANGTHVAYLDGGIVVVRGLDGSTPAAAAGDPAVKDLERVNDHSAPLLSPSGDRVARLSFGGADCQLVVAMPDGTAAHVIQPSTCGYAVLAAWSPDGRQVLLLREMDGAFGLQAVGVDSPLDLTVVSMVSTNGARSSPGRGDVSWQPVIRQLRESAASKESLTMRASHRLVPVSFTIAVALLAGACSAAAGPPTTGPSSVPSAALAAQLTATLAPTRIPMPSTPTPASSASPSSTATPAPTFAYDATALTAGSHAALVMGTGAYPAYSVVVPAGWFDVAGHHFVLKYPAVGGPVLGLSVWDVAQVFRDPCRWQGTGFDPGPSVGALVAALAAQPMRNATRPTDVTLAGYKGQYLELSVPTDLKSSTWTNFDACDVDESGSHDFQGWLGNGMGNRYEQVPGQVDRLWVLDVNGQRLVVDATYSPDTTSADRIQLQKLVESLRFDGP